VRLLQWIPSPSLPRIEEPRFRWFLVTFATFLVAAPFVLSLIGRLTGRTYFIVSFVWLLVSSEVFAPAEPEVSWWAQLRWVKAGGWIVLGYIVFERVAAVL